MAIVSAAHGGDAWEQWARLMATGSWNLPPRAWAAGSAFFRGQGPGRMVAAVEGLDAALADLGDTVTRASLPKVGQPRASGYEGEGWAIVRHETTDGAVAALRRLVTDTRITYR